LVLVNADKNNYHQDLRSVTPEINKKRIKIDEPEYKVRPTKSSLIRERNVKNSLNLSGDSKMFNYEKRGLSPQKSNRDLNKKYQNDELNSLIQRYQDLNCIVETNDWAKLLRPKLKTVPQTIHCIEEILTARHS